VDVLNSQNVAITFTTLIAGLERLFDQVAIVSSKSPQKYMATLGPYYVAEHKAGSSVLLRRNSNYWKRDSAGRHLPYIDTIRLDIQQNRDLELHRFRRGEVHLINSLDAESFGQLATEMPAAAHDDGPSIDSEQIWFNQVPTAPIAPYKKAWFGSTGFRRAISEAINRADLCRIVYSGHAHPAVGPVPAANHFWSNHSLQPHPYDAQSAIRRLKNEGFRLEDGVLRDRDGHGVEFSLITNAGNKSRERMATLIQQDLAQIGIRLNVVTLDFPSLIERITRTFDYEACLLGLVNDDLDPNAQMNVWLSSASNHQWNPQQKTPATPWEAEIDRLMRTQGSATDAHQRKLLFDQVQQIAWAQEPFIYLVNKNCLSAISPKLKGSTPVALRPQAYWNIEHLSFIADKN
jgi:peptide/nickel transport system substrate-binding protein